MKRKSNRYLVITEAYTRYSSSEAPAFRFFTAKNDPAAILKAYASDCDAIQDYATENGDEKLDTNAILERLHEANGDGKDFVTIINLRTEEVIFGLG